MLAKVANALGISWYCVGDDDGKRAKVEPVLKRHLDGADEVDRFVFPYRNIEVNLLRHGHAAIYQNRMPQQNLRKLKKTPGDPGYWEDFAAKLPGRAKTRAASEVAIKIEAGGGSGVTPEIRDVLEKVVAAAREGEP